jgi:integrase
MSRIFRQAYVKPIPHHAEKILVNGKKCARWKDGDKIEIAPLTAKGDKVRFFLSRWYGEYHDIDGNKVREPLCEDEAAAQLMLADKVRKVELAKLGVVNQFEAHDAKSLADHLADFKTMLASKEIEKFQVEQKYRRVHRALVEWCAFKTLKDIHVDAVQRALKEHVPGDQTRHRYANETRSFGRWLLRSRRVADDPLAQLAMPKVKKIRRRRRPLQDEELRSLLAAAKASKRPFRGLTGEDRHWLYCCASYTGLRAEELSKLTPESFRLADPIPVVYLSGEHTKNSKACWQPIPQSVAANMASYLRDKPADKPVWPGTWNKRAARMMKRDLAEAGIAITSEGTEGKLVLDFHALRHATVRLLWKAGANQREAMQLARHSDPKLTSVTYGQESLKELAEVMNRCPNLTEGDDIPANVAFLYLGIKTEKLASIPAAYLGYAQTSPLFGREVLIELERVITKDPSEADRLTAVGANAVMEAANSELRPAGFEPATLGLGNIGFNTKTLDFLSMVL